MGHVYFTFTGGTVHITPDEVIDEFAKQNPANTPLQFDSLKFLPHERRKWTFCRRSGDW